MAKKSLAVEQKKLLQLTFFILVTPSNGDRKIKQSIRIMSAPPMKGKKRNQSSKFR